MVAWTGWWPWRSREEDKWKRYLQETKWTVTDRRWGRETRARWQVPRESVTVGVLGSPLLLSTWGRRQTLFCWASGAGKACWSSVCFRS